MPRIIWKGAISFGLVHVPVALYPASSETGIDFDWLDKRSMDPVGYKRINKRTGKEIARENIVKGIKQEGGEYVVLSDDEIRAAYPKTTQTIEIQSFVRADEIPFVYLDAPYYLEPAAKGDKVYALLREAMLDCGVVGVANVVMHTKQHLAALIPSGRGLVLNTLRWAGEIRPWTELKLPAEGRRGNGITDAEMKMARQLIGDMTGRWDATRYVDRFSDAVRALAKQRVEAGQTAQVEPVEKDDGGGASNSNVVDLTALLKQSLARKPSDAASKDVPEPAAKAASPNRKSRKSPGRNRA